jgi:hypothetical protein
MMSTLTNPIFLLAVVVAAINQLLEKAFGIFIPIVHSYLDDLLCFPIVLTLGLAMYRCFRPNYQLTGWHIWPTIIIYTVYFEWYLPQTSALYTADILDVVMYLVGMTIFDYFINQNDGVGLEQTKS